LWNCTQKLIYVLDASTPPHVKAPGKSANGAHSSKEVSKMRTEADIKAKLDELRITQRAAFEARLVWSSDSLSERISTIEWVLAMRDEL